MLHGFSLFGLSGLLAVSVAALGWVSLDAWADPSRFALYAMLAALFAASALAAWLWLRRVDSAGAMWRRAWQGVGVVVVVAAVVVIAESFGLVGEREEFEGGPRCPECELAVVERMVDGDTLIAGGQRIRLYGVDAPELGEPCGDEATERLRELSGSRVRLESGPRTEDEFGRRLAYLYTEDGRSIDAALVWGGYARAWTSDGRHRGELIELEIDARRSGRGCLW